MDNIKGKCMENRTMSERIKVALPVIIAMLTCLAMWGCYTTTYKDIKNDVWRTDYITGLDFEQAPNYFKHIENRDLARLAIEEGIIFSMGLLLVVSFKNKAAV